MLIITDFDTIVFKLLTITRATICNLACQKKTMRMCKEKRHAG